MCWCGAKAPSASHLLWVCDATAAHRRQENIRMPKHSMEERTLVPVIPRRRGHSGPHVPPEAVRNIDALVKEYIKKDGTIYLATDGSMKGQVCGSSWATRSGATAALTEGPYAAPFFAELFARHVAIERIYHIVIEYPETVRITILWRLQQVFTERSKTLRMMGHAIFLEWAQPPQTPRLAIVERANRP